ncbi:MAG: ImmA/IrrE family metallo-endopeptidase [Desulfobacterales bacterium]|nr:ImmA/IrrE family metallo-endopeptidase [Desulfobacterales bacterium]
MAVQLERTFSISANIWNHLNADYSLYEARIKDSERNKTHFEWLKEFPIRELKKNGFLPNIKDYKILLEKLLELFSIPSPEQWKNYYEAKSVNFRKSDCFAHNMKHIITWIRTGELLASEIEAKPYFKEVFKESFKKIRQLTLLEPKEFISNLKSICNDSGVILVFVPEFEKTHISGATRWLTAEKALIIMSLRYKTNDHFWFTFFHEAGHILLHSKKQVFIDDELKGSKEEEEANQFASHLLIPENEYKQFISKKLFSQTEIKKFAEKIAIHPGIIVGRLQYDRLINFKYHNDLKEYWTINDTTSFFIKDRKS